MAGADAAPAGGADHVRPEGGGLARRGLARARAAARARARIERLAVQLGGAGGHARRARRRRPRGAPGCFARELGLAGAGRALAHEPRADRRARRGARARRRARWRRSRSTSSCSRRPRSARCARARAAAGRRRRCRTSATRSARRRARSPARARRAGTRRRRCSAAMAQEHERAAGAWHAEWEALSGALALTGGAAAARASARGPRGRRRADAREPRRPRGRCSPSASARASAAPDALGSTRTRARRSARSRRADDARRRRRPLLDPLDALDLGSAEARPSRSSTRALDAGGSARVVASSLDGAAGAALVLANSLGTTLELWERQAAARWPTASARPLRPARPRRLARRRPGPYTIEDLGRDVLDLLDELGLERVSFCGLSLGGAVGQWLGAHAPERIDRLVLACTSARFGRRREVARARRDRPRATASRRSPTPSLERWFTAAFRAATPRGRGDASARCSSRRRPEGYAGCCEALAALGLPRPARAGSARPTLVIAGADDPVAPPDHARGSIAEAIPGAAGRLEHAAHLANVEQPRTFTSASSTT